MLAGLGALTPYNDELRGLLALLVRGGDPSGAALRAAATNLDGRAGREFRRLVPLGDRRDAGTFFTGSDLRARAIARYRPAIAAGVHAVDPACGMGDLLLAAADLIPTTWTPSRRAAHARAFLHGRDIHAPLVGAAAARLALWSAVAGAAPADPDRWPVEIGDAFGEDLDWSRFGLVLLNPPYAATRLPDRQGWATGSVTGAAPFTLDVVRRTRPGARIAAILPDVLRTGARYAKWRAEIDRLADLEDVDIVGPFDKWTDVDVFVAHLRRRGPRTAAAGTGSWYQVEETTHERLGDIVTVSVGDVVPHRDVPAGPTSPYLTVDCLPAWATTLRTGNTVRHGGRLHEPPFVVLRRTSAPTRSPGAVRARAAVYTGPGPVAVENHLLVLKPPSAGGVDACMRLAVGFAEPAVTDWLDRRLRLRHLTVTALRDLPTALLTPARPA